MFGRTRFLKRILVTTGSGACLFLFQNCAPMQSALINREQSAAKLQDSPVFGDVAAAAQGNIVQPANPQGNIVQPANPPVPTPSPGPRVSPTPSMTPPPGPTPRPTATPMPTPPPPPRATPTPRPTATPSAPPRPTATPGQPAPTPRPSPTATPGPGRSPTPTPTPHPHPHPGTCHQHETPASSLPVFLVCSNRLSAQVGSLQTSTSLTVEIVPARSSSGRHQYLGHFGRTQTSQTSQTTAACSFNVSGLGQEILRTRKLDLNLVDQRCPNLPQGSYEIRVIDPKPGNVGALNFDEAGGPGEPVVTKLGNGQWNVRPTGQLPLVAAAQQAGVVCQLNRSPLMIRMEDRVRDPELLFLTSPLSGISFDLLGQNAKPAPHTPVNISWFKSGTSSYYFLALPNENGDVEGIDELFGNDTMGPDGHLSANGFTALAKHDIRSASHIANGVKMATPDGLITPEDPVYSRLRLWQDHNLDGRSQPDELYTLPEMGLTAISLNYDPTYFEEDRYGNQIRFKSVVKTTDGRLHIIFDLWFAVGGGNY